jgi:hypothetical protein
MSRLLARARVRRRPALSARAAPPQRGLQPVLCRDHALRRSRVLRRDLRLSSSNRESGSAHFRSGSTCLGRVQQPVLVSCGSLDSGRAS